MPVSTRSSQFVVRQDEKLQPQEQSEQLVVLPVSNTSRRTSLARDPQHGLKEKMRALTVLYEQHQKQRLASRRDSVTAEQQLESRPIATHHASVELLDSCRKKKEASEDQENLVIEMKENIVVLNPPRTAKNHEVFRRMDTKENRESKGNGKSVAVFSCPPKQEPLARKLSLGGLGGPVSDGKFGEFKVHNGPTVGSENMDSGGSRILVFVRLRPLAKKEKEAGARSCVKIVNRKDVYLTEFASENDYLRLKRLRGRHFCFDASFPDTTSQLEVYATTAADLVEGVLQGRNGSVFCYGATGAGKTYTMLGSVENPGVMVLAIKDLFSKIRQRSYDGNHSVQLSYLEVYNETVRDLLSPGRPLVLREDKQGIVAAGLTQYRAYTTDEVMALLQRGNQNRTTEPTRVNETSSRSHAILQVVAEYKVINSGQVVQRIGKLSLIDLAGSERALATDQRTLRSVEGANINRSLLALSSCINALVEGKKHIPYRNSKLTQLLKDSLGGPCNTVMIANISPSNLSFGETQNTLHWADRAKEIKTKACTLGEAMQIPQSETDQTKLVLELQKENSELRQLIARHQQKLLTVQAQSLAASPAPSVAPSPLCSPPLCSTQRKPKRCIIAGNCFGTPESKSRATNELENQDLRRRVKDLEAEIEILKKEHLLQIKQKDDLIRDLVTKYNIKPLESDKERRVTRASATARKVERSARETGELKSPGHRFISPIPPAKKRSFWDVSTTNSPSPTVATKGRKLRSSIANETAVPSMLLQPGFARQRPDPSKK